MVTPALSTTSWLLSFRLSGCMPVRTVIVPVNNTTLVTRRSEHKYTQRKINVVKYSTAPVGFEVGSVADPDPNPAVGSFYNQAKIVRKPLLLLFCDIFVTFYLRKMMFNKQKDFI
jgi:hypothetical protein